MLAIKDYSLSRCKLFILTLLILSTLTTHAEEPQPADAIGFNVTTTLGGGYYPWGDSLTPAPSPLADVTGTWKETYKSLRGYNTTVSSEGSFGAGSLTLIQNTTLKDTAYGPSYLYEAFARSNVNIYVRSDLATAANSFIISRTSTSARSTSATGSTSARAQVDVSKRLSFESKTPNEVNNFGTEGADEFVARASGYCPMIVAGKKYCRIWGAEFNALSGGYDGPAKAGGEMESNSTLTSTLKVTIVPATDGESAKGTSP
jgi:hypothetical protein